MVDNILNKSDGFAFNVSNSDYFDTFLSPMGHNDLGYIFGNLDYTHKVIADFKMDNSNRRYDWKNNKLYSDVIWERALNELDLLSNIGYVGADNGLLPFDKKYEHINYNMPEDLEKEEEEISERCRIVNENVFKSFYPFEERFEEQDIKDNFYLSKVEGHIYNKLYEDGLIDIYNDYEVEFKDECLSFKGGILQGFYKIYDKEYQVLPERPDKEWGFEFILSPQSSYPIENTVNAIYPDNQGIFLYMGLKQENKFWYFSDQVDAGDYGNKNFNTEDSEKHLGQFNDECFDTLFLDDSKKTIKDMDKTNHMGVPYYTNQLNYYETDNKFLTFNRTISGNTVDDIKHEEIAEYIKPTDTAEVEIPFKQIIETDNKHLYYNRTSSGSTVENIKENPATYSDEIFMDDDFIANGIAFRINGSKIGYKILARYCPESGEDALFDEESDNTPTFKLIEDYSKEGVIKDGKKQHIFIRYIANEEGKCLTYLNAPRQMKVMIYVDGLLVLSSKWFEEPIFRPLYNEIGDKQETVPFNLTIGGGTLGLSESIFTLNGLDRKIFPIEENFCGSFMGDIYRFRMHDNPTDFTKILNNYRYFDKQK